MTGSTKTAAKPAQVEEDYNVLRDTPLRYLGYCNEVGESFRYQLPRFVTPSYVISFGYCGADAVQAAWRVWSSTETVATPSQRRHDSFRALVDTAVWQCTASVMVPGATIHAIVKAARWMVRRPALALPAAVVEWLPTAAGLGSIPVIVHPIDHMTDVLLDETLRKVWKPVIPTSLSTRTASEKESSSHPSG